jgi:lipopolysaccharide transport system ATP-binding protein
MTEIAILVDDVSKCFPKRRSFASLMTSRALTQTSEGEGKWALRNISLEIPSGSSVGIIGLNGSGKSTLLEIIAGTLLPTSGSVHRQGRVAALLELSSGFNPDRTGTENVLLNGMVAGFARSEVEQRFDEIARFADIGQVLDHPVKTYSSGMLARLAFALHTVFTPDILIIDEILSVGDYFFQQKCYRRLAEMREAGVTQLFVSHDLALVRDLCDQTAYLRGGCLAYWGSSSAAIHRMMTDGPMCDPHAWPAHKGDLTRETQISFADAVWQPREGQESRLVGVRICREDGESTLIHTLGSHITIEVWFLTSPQDRDLIIGLAIKNRFDQTVTSINSSMLGCHGISHTGTALRCFEFELDLCLEGGEYSLRLGLNRPPESDETDYQSLDSTDWFGPITVNWDYQNDLAPFFGMFGLPMSGKLRSEPLLPTLASEGQV